MKRLPWLTLFPAFFLVGPLAAQDQPKPTESNSPKPTADTPEPIEIPDAIKGITARELGGHMRFLASDLMRGRDTASHEIRLAGEYLASRLFAAGAEASGDPDQAGRKTYFQRFPLEVTTALQDGTSVSLELQMGDSRRTIPLQLGSDVTIFPQGLTPVEIDAQVVFAGYGRDGAGGKPDDYRGIEVRNRFVVVLSGQPPAGLKGGEKADEKAEAKSQPPTRGRPGMAGANQAKVEAASKRGALGLIVIQPTSILDSRRAAAPAPGQPFPGFGRASMTLGSPTLAIPMLTLADPIRDLIFQASPIDAAEPDRKLLEGVRAHFKFSARRELKDDRNVIGFFPGSDPEKKKEVVIFSAHYDHVGVDEKGEIFNGSDDNASGTSALLELAEAFGDGPKPARSVAILWVSGEEKGLLGSRWFSDHISLPSDHKIVADINIDMVSRNDGRSIGVTPSSGHPSHTNLVTLAEASAKAEGLEIKYNADQFFGRTDSANFARKGIPVVFFFSGLHDDYHKATDDVEKADFDKAARVARAAFRLGWQVAQAPEAPKKIKAD